MSWYFHNPEPIRRGSTESRVIGIAPGKRGVKNGFSDWQGKTSCGKDEILQGALVADNNNL